MSRLFLRITIAWRHAHMPQFHKHCFFLLFCFNSSDTNWVSCNSILTLTTWRTQDSTHKLYRFIIKDTDPEQPNKEMHRGRYERVEWVICLVEESTLSNKQFDVKYFVKSLIYILLILKFVSGTFSLCIGMTYLLVLFIRFCFSWNKAVLPDEVK